MRASVWAGFGGYCLLAGSRWLVNTVVPPVLAGTIRVGVHALVVAVLLGGWWMVRGRVRAKAGWLPLAAIGLLAGMVFLLPDAVTEAGAASVNGLTAALVFTLAPVVVVVLVAQQSFEFGMGEDPRSLLVPALAGVFGAALVIPFSMPVSLAGKVWLSVLVGSLVVATVAAVQLHEMLRTVPLVLASAVVSGVVGVAGLLVGHEDWAALRGLDGRGMVLEGGLAVVVDGPLLVLGLWLLREMPPLAVVTRYPLVLLVTIGESYLLMHGTASWPMAVGVVMMAGSAAWLLKASTSRVDDLRSTSRGEGV